MLGSCQDCGSHHQVFPSLLADRSHLGQHTTAGFKVITESRTSQWEGLPLPECWSNLRHIQCRLSGPYINRSRHLNLTLNIIIFEGSALKVVLNKGSPDFFRKGPTSKYFRPVGHIVSARTIPFAIVA